MITGLLPFSVFKHLPYISVLPTNIPFICQGTTGKTFPRVEIGHLTPTGRKKQLNWGDSSEGTAKTEAPSQKVLHDKDPSRLICLTCRAWTFSQYFAVNAEIYIGAKKFSSKTINSKQRYAGFSYNIIPRYSGFQVFPVQINCIQPVILTRTSN